MMSMFSEFIEFLIVILNIVMISFVNMVSVLVVIAIIFVILVILSLCYLKGWKTSAGDESLTSLLATRRCDRTGKYGSDARSVRSIVETLLGFRV